MEETAEKISQDPAVVRSLETTGKYSEIVANGRSAMRDTIEALKESLEIAKGMERTKDVDRLIKKIVAAQTALQRHANATEEFRNCIVVQAFASGNLVQNPSYLSYS